jgi:phosphate transport system protein
VADHTVKAYDRELDALGRAIIEMGGVVRKMLVDSLDSLATADVGLAQEVVTTGLGFAKLRCRVESEAILTIARRAPVACDLRDVVAAIRIAGDLSRVAAHAQSIADHTVNLGSAVRIPLAILGHKHMSALAIDLMNEALDAYAERDADRARSVWERDADLDSLEGSVYGDLLSQMIDDPRAITFCAHMMSVTKHIERVGDHATNIAETVMYLVTGFAPADERPRGRGTASIEPVAYDEDF